MAFPVTHILAPMFIIEIYRRYFAKKKFSHWYVFLAGFMGGAPDFDIIFGWIMSNYYGVSVNYHRMFTHSLFFALIFLLIGVLIYFLGKYGVLAKKKAHIGAFISVIIFVGIASHSLLDCIDGLKAIFSPFCSVNCPSLLINEERAAIIDGILLFSWILFRKPYFNDIKSLFKKKRYKK